MHKRLLVISAIISACVLANAAQAGPKEKSDALPPGLEKKAKAGKPLPPGWQKKLQVGAIIEPEIYAHAKVIVPIGKHGEITVDIDGRLLKLHEKTREILDILR